MQTFKEYLLGEDTRKARTQVVSVADFIKWADSNAQAYLNGSNFLYRGGSGDRQKGLRIGNAAGKGITPRQSANTANNYTLWIDNHPSFRGWPKRSLSFIGTDDRDVAEGFGGAAMLIVADNAKVGVVGKSDLWETPLPPTDFTIEDLNGVTSYLLEDNIDSYESLVSALKGLGAEEVSASLEGQSRMYDDLLEFIVNSRNLNNLYDVWDALVKPKIFAGKTTGAKIGNVAGEVWIQGEVGFIPHIQRLSNEDAQQLAEWVQQYPNLKKHLHNVHWDAEFEDYYGDD